MVDARFFSNAGPFSLQQICQHIDYPLPRDVESSRSFSDVAPLDRAQASDVSFLDNPKYADSFAHTQAGVVFVREKYAVQSPKNTIALICSDPYRSYALTAQLFYPYIPSGEGISANASIHPTASIGENVTIADGAVIGANVIIGSHSNVGPNAVIEKGVTIGEHTRIGALCSISHSLIGDHCILHRGVHIGQDGFGFAMSREGHVKVPQLGRVVIADHVEIGAGSCIDRGTGPDTTIGMGTKIDNLVQIGHNVTLGKGAVIVAQTGIAGSSRIGDGAVLAGQVGIAGHLRIGAGARLAAQAGVMQDVPPGSAYGGSPAMPIKEWHRQTLALKKLTKPRTKDAKSDE